ncbi:MAG: GNAT family N-acetyltransferase [Myxococcaceae bacterium]|nr:GNAT family N-acetyltransferase [Myxococcaceae bacterium]
MELVAHLDVAAASLLGRAFARDPAFVWVLPDEATRAAKLTWLASRLLRLVRQSGGRVDSSDAAPSAVALWLPIDGPFEESLWRYLRAGLWAAPLVLGARAIQRLRVVEGPTTELHRTLAPTPHDYLLQLAVDPSRQGGGVGSALLHEGLARAAAGGRGVWLETTNPRNVPFYERAGLTARGTRNLPGGVTLVGLSRPAP